MSTNSQFWIINTAGWFIFLLCAGLFFSYLSGSLSWQTLWIQSVAFAYYVPATGLMRRGIKKSPWLNQKTHAQLIPWLLLITLLLALTGQFLISMFMMYGLKIMTWDNYSVQVLLLTTGQNWIILCLWTAMYLMLKQVRNNRQQLLKQAQLEANLHATELKALKAQLNPHFIFNCFNNMRALALDDAEKTREMITHLSEILKYSFQFGEQTKVTVAREIQHVKNYLALEKIQFEDRLSYDFQVDTAVEQQLIPTLSIQLLVENAIKHGIMGLPAGGHIQVNVTRVNDITTITVTNSGQMTTKNSHQPGIGLANLRKRLDLLYADEADLSIQNVSETQVAVQINLPSGNQHE